MLVLLLPPRPPLSPFGRALSVACLQFAVYLPLLLLLPIAAVADVVAAPAVVAFQIMFVYLIAFEASTSTKRCSFS